MNDAMIKLLSCKGHPGRKEGRFCKECKTNHSMSYEWFQKNVKPHLKTELLSKDSRLGELVQKPNPKCPYCHNIMGKYDEDGRRAHPNEDQFVWGCSCGAEFNNKQK